MCDWIIHFRQKQEFYRFTSEFSVLDVRANPGETDWENSQGHESEPHRAGGPKHTDQNQTVAANLENVMAYGH